MVTLYYNTFNNIISEHNLPEYISWGSRKGHSELAASCTWMWCPSASGHYTPCTPREAYRLPLTPGTLFEILVTSTVKFTICNCQDTMPHQIKLNYNSSDHEFRTSGSTTTCQIGQILTSQFLKYNLSTYEIPYILDQKFKSYSQTNIQSPMLLLRSLFASLTLI